MFGTNWNSWLLFCFRIFLCFCNWYTILTSSVEIPSFESLKSTDFTCEEREKLYSIPDSLWLLPAKISAKFISNYKPQDGMAGQKCRRRQLFAAVRSLSSQWCGDQSGLPFIFREKTWYWYSSVVVFVVWGLAGETASGPKSCQDGGNQWEACLWYIRRRVCSYKQP